MIKKVTVINYLGEILEMPLANPYESGFAICSINGLGPVKANINVTELATDDGSFYNSARALSRNITMSLKFFDTSQRTVEDVRQSSYRYFPLKKQLTLIVETDNRSAYCRGYVESNEPDIFSSDERCNISIICPDPWFYEYGNGEETQIIFNGIENLFEFPFENNTEFTYEENHIEVSSFEEGKSCHIFYSGDVELGFSARLKFSGAATNIVLYNIDTGESMVIATDRITALTGAALGDGDEIIIDTRQGLKAAQLLRNGVFYNILSALGRDTDWLMLRPGDNYIGYGAESGENNITITISYQTAYEGV